jgi:hypothetical protein
MIGQEWEGGWASRIFGALVLSPIALVLVLVVIGFATDDSEPAAQPPAHVNRPGHPEDRAGNQPGHPYGGGAGDIDCSSIDGPVAVGRNDPNQLDADGDGIGCEPYP